MSKRFNFFVYALFVIAASSLAYCIYTNDYSGMIPAGFGTIVFGSCSYMAWQITRVIKGFDESE